MDMTLAQKQTLQSMVQGGKQVATVAYNPTTVVGTPETDATNAGWVVYLRQATTYLVEVVYTK